MHAHGGMCQFFIPTMPDNDLYTTVVSDAVGEGFYSEKRSKFYAFAHHVATLDEVKTLVASYRQKYYDARHCCYAYVLGPDGALFRANDDGEPSSTAGKPILGQIHARQLTDVLVVVVRYYGGINLGTGGLIVAYREAAADALSHIAWVEKQVEETIDYEFTYPMMNGVMHLIKELNATIVSQEFDNVCKVSLRIRQRDAQLLRSRLAELSFQ